MNNPSWKLFYSFYIWYIRIGEMPRRNDNVVELFHILFSHHQILSTDCKQIFMGVVFNVSYGIFKTNPVSNSWFFQRELKGSPEVVLFSGMKEKAVQNARPKYIVSVFIDLFWGIDPHMKIHSTVNRLTIFVESGSSSHIPLPDPFTLFYKANYFWYSMLA